VYGVAAVLWPVTVLKGPAPRRAAVDVVVIITLCLLSGGATAALLPVFSLLPIFMALQDRPTLTVIGTATALGYLAVWISIPNFTRRPG
jgi:two-component system, NarL family, sensor kinase